MLNLNKEYINLMNGIDTKKFGYVRFLTLKDLMLIGEERYGRIIATYAQNIELYEDLPDEINEFDLIMLKFNDGSRMSFPDGETLLDVVIDSLVIMLDIKIEDIIADDSISCIVYKKDDKFYNINRDNFSELVDIVLKSNMSQKTQPDYELSFKNKDMDEKYRKRMEDFLQHVEKDEEKNRNSIMMIANLVMAKLKLYGDKETLLSMTIHNLLFAFSAENEEDNYEKTYRQYLAGADVKKLDMTHWYKKVKGIIKKEE